MPSVVAIAPFLLSAPFSGPAFAQVAGIDAGLLSVGTDPLVRLDPRMPEMMVREIEPARIPPPIRAMLDAAIAGNNANEIAAIVKYGAQAAPDYGQEIRALADAWRTDREQQRIATIRGAGVLDLWDGRGEVGGFFTTGNSENSGVSGKLDIRREGLRWRHRLAAAADYQQSLGFTTRERFSIGYEPNLKFDDRRYAYGALLYESDPFLGYDNRFSASAGIGYGLIRQAAMTLDVTIGPAFRHTDYVMAMNEDGYGGRGSVDFDWRLSPGLKLTQDAFAYIDTLSRTVAATSGVEARLLGPLSARLSYNIQYESRPLGNRVNTDTIGRASLVYDF